MYVLTNYTFTPNVGEYDRLIIPGVFSIEQFDDIQNATRNTTLYTSGETVHLGAIQVSDDGVQTTVLIYPADKNATASDEIRILMYDLAPTGSGPTANVAVTNWPASQNINGAVSVNGEVEIKNDTGNPLPVSGTVSVGNFPATQPISGTVNVGNFPASQAVTGTFWQTTQPVSGSVSVSNFPATQPISGSVSVSNLPATQPVSGSVSVSNFPATQPVSGTVTANQGTSPWVTSVGNFPATQNVAGTVTANQGTSPWVTSVNNFPATQSVTQGTSPWVISGTVTAEPVSLSSFPAMATDAFNRLRVSEPFTLFDSSYRYGDNGLWATNLSAGGTATFNPAQGLMDLSVTGVVGDSVSRQTTKVFSYQPGKSLLLLTTFVMAPAVSGLTQQVGYYGDANGYYLQLQNSNLSFVERSSVTGSVINTPILQANWNVDKLDGTGPSGLTLDITKAQILFIDMEWLGVGTVRVGFVIDGQFVPCHYFQHANLITSTYITTASLPLSCSIQNTSATGVTSTLKQICSTVISEGGYTLSGLQQSVGTPITAPKTLTVAGTYYPVVSLRLKASKLDAIVILTAISLLGSGNNETYRWQVMANAVTTGGTWTDAGLAGAVEYNLTGTAITGGRILAAGFMSASNQGSPSVDILKQALFANQLERNPFTNTPYEICIAVAGAGASQLVYASMDWEEVSR
jgi:hypothetical protein